MVSPEQLCGRCKAQPVQTETGGKRDGCTSTGRSGAEFKTQS